MAIVFDEILKAKASSKYYFFSAILHM